MNESTIENRVTKLEERINVMEVTQAKFEKSIEYFDRTVGKLEKVVDRMVDDGNLNIVQWIKKNFITLLLLGGLALYMLGIIKP